MRDPYGPLEPHRTGFVVPSLQLGTLTPGEGLGRGSARRLDLPGNCRVPEPPEVDHWTPPHERCCTSLRLGTAKTQLRASGAAAPDGLLELLRP